MLPPINGHYQADRSTVITLLDQNEEKKQKKQTNQEDEELPGALSHQLIDGVWGLAVWFLHKVHVCNGLDASDVPAAAVRTRRRRRKPQRQIQSGLT